MKYRPQRRAADAIGQYRFRMAVDHALHAAVFFVDLAVDEAFGVAFGGVGVHGAGVADVVFFEVGAGGDEGGGEGFGDEEGGGVLGVADGDVAVGFYF